MASTSIPTRGDRPLTTRIAEADPTGGVLRYRGVDIADLIGVVSYGSVWGLLVDDAFDPGLPAAERFPLPVRTGNVRADVQAALAVLGTVWGMRPLHDINAAAAREDLARSCVLTLSMVAQSARGPDRPVIPERAVDQGHDIVERFLLRWHGEVDPVARTAIDAYWVTLAENGLSSSTLAARIIASTGADVTACLSGAVGAISGPLHGGAPARAWHLMTAVAHGENPDGLVQERLVQGHRLMGFGHRVYQYEDPRASQLRRVCENLGAPLYEAAVAVERCALERLHERKPDRPWATNAEFWAAVLLDGAGVPPELFTAMFLCARSAGWSAHILEQHDTGRLLRPVADYAGWPPRPVSAVPGWIG